MVLDENRRRRQPHQGAVGDLRDGGVPSATER